MLSLLKKKNDATQPQFAAWHPNFRNYERLPDVKTVRTAFFANAVAVAVALSAVLWVAYQEYTCSLVRGDIAIARAELSRDKGPSDQAVAVFKKFQADEKKVREMSAFVASKPSVSAMYITLGSTLVEQVSLTHIEIAPTQIGLRGVVHGSSDVASSIASTYIDALKAEASISQLCSGVTQVNATRNPQTGWLNIELALRFKGGK
jgi:hypothetical protein